MKSFFENRKLVLLVLSLVTVAIHLTGCSFMKKNDRTTKLQDDKKSYFNHPEIIQNNNKEGNIILGNENADVENTTEIMELVEKMQRILTESKGLGLAAPQVGVNKKVVVIRRVDKENKPIEVYINPVIKWMSEEKETDYEGCLSVREGIGKVVRSKRIKVRYQTIDDRELEDDVTGMTARIFQHEVDHLAGILFIDKKTDDPLITLEEYMKIKEERKAAGRE